MHLIPHEFFHVFHFNMVTHLFAIPGFHSEGMAEIMAYENENFSYLTNRSWYFRDGDAGYINYLRSLAGMQTDVENETQLPTEFNLAQLW